MKQSTSNLQKYGRNSEHSTKINSKNREKIDKKEINMAMLCETHTRWIIAKLWCKIYSHNEIRRDVNKFDEKVTWMGRNKGNWLGFTSLKLCCYCSSSFFSARNNQIDFPSEKLLHNSGGMCRVDNYPLLHESWKTSFAIQTLNSEIPESLQESQL